MATPDLHERDRILLATLQSKLKQKQPADFIRPDYNKSQLFELEQLLAANGTTAIPMADGFMIEVDGEPRPVSIVAATDTNASHGDMSSMLYLRDHIQAASALMELYLHDSSKYKAEGEQAKILLLSALHLVSTKAQLARFNDVIARGAAAGQEDWPHISLFFNDLAGEKPNGWRNKQDSFQMLAYLTCDALMRGFLHEDGLLPSHKTYLASIAPLLKSVGFPLYENSGSWEELEARRTSVMAVETALLGKMQQLLHIGKADFLAEQSSLIDELFAAGLQEIARRLPNESPDYAKNDIKYRTADAALIYVLLYDIPKLLADAQIAIGDHGVITQRQIEDLVLEILADLNDPLTGGIIRYKDDSYQRVNFHTNQVQQIIHDIKQRVKDEAKERGGQVDLDAKQRLRDELTPKGREAAWTHPLGQLASSAAKRSLESPDDEAAHYHQQSVEYLNRMLALVTGDDDWHAVLGEDGYYKVVQAPAFKLPECYVTYRTADGNEFIVPSPHTPLNWSSATLRQAVGLLQ
jgi:hypothetical protein